MANNLDLIWCMNKGIPGHLFRDNLVETRKQLKIEKPNGAMGPGGWIKIIEKALISRSKFALDHKPEIKNTITKIEIISDNDLHFHIHYFSDTAPSTMEKELMKIFETDFLLTFGGFSRLSSRISVSNEKGN